MPPRPDREIALAIRTAVTCARHHGALEIGGEHLLVGVTHVLTGRQGSELARLGLAPSRVEEAVSRGAHDARLLAGLGIDLAAVQRQVGDRLSTRWRTRRPRFRTDAKQAIDASRRGVRALGTNRIWAEHLLLGLLDSSVAARELVLALDIDPLAVRRTVLRALTDGE